MNIEQEIKLQIGELAVSLMAMRAENAELKAKIAELEKPFEVEAKKK